MFTRCPDCGTVFRVTANQLRAARGDVRCGNCAHVFNAMESLADELPRPQEEPTPAANETAEESLEFDAPEQTWGEIFIAAPERPRDIPLDGELEAITADPDEWRSMLAELGVEPGDIDPAAEVEDDGIVLGAASLLAEGEADAEAFEAGPDDALAAAEPFYTSDDAAAEATGSDEYRAEPAAVAPAPAPERFTPGLHPATDAAAGDDDREQDSDIPPWGELEVVAATAARRSGSIGWAIAALVLAVGLAAQLAHQWRDSLAADPRYGEVVRKVYARLGQRLYPDWPLDAFYVRRSEALAGGSAPDALDINAAVEVTGAQAVGLPLVRVTLRDQWSNTVGRRVFLPAEYLASGLPDIVPPGTRIPVALSLADPGTSARGYEVDLCLQRRRTGLECQQAERPLQP